MPHRHELSEAEWARIAPLLPPRETNGTYYKDHRLILNGILFRLQTGCPWRIYAPSLEQYIESLHVMAGKRPSARP